MDSLLRLSIFDPDPNVVAAIRNAFADVSAVTVTQVDQMLYLKPPAGLDILYLPLAAAERWGAKPLVHRSQVLATTTVDQKQGLPPFIVTGTCLAPEDPRSPHAQLSILLRSVFDAIRDFAKAHPNQTITVGFWAYNLLKSVSPREMRQVLLETVPELCSHAD
jgi:hypothetical protein